MNGVSAVFQRLGSGMGIPLLTTTIKRLEEHGPLGNFGCWSMYGQPARIGQGRRASWLLARCAHGGATAGSTSILRILEDTLPGPRPEESVRSAISPGFPAVPVTLPPEKGAGKAPERASTPILEAAEGIPAEV